MLLNCGVWEDSWESLVRRIDSLEKTLMLRRIGGRRRRGRQRIWWLDGITDWWTWVWMNSGTWWWTGRPGELQFLGSQKSDTTERLNWTELNWSYHCHWLYCFGFEFIHPFCVSCLEKIVSISWRAGLVVLNSLSFCLSVKLLISPSYLSEILAGYSHLGCRLFSFITLSVSCNSLLAWIVSIERSAVILVCYLEFPCVLFVVFPLLLLFYFIFSMKHSLFVQLNSIQMLESWTSMYQQGQISKTYVNENHKSQKDGYVWSDTIYVKYYSTILYIFFYLLR